MLRWEGEQRKFHFWLRQQQRPYLDRLTFTFNMMSQTLLGHLFIFQIPLFRLGERAKNRKTTETLYKPKTVFEAARSELPIRSYSMDTPYESKLMPSMRMGLHLNENYYFIEHAMHNFIEHAVLFGNFDSEFSIKYASINNLYLRKKKLQK
jgi:hypothetical protein